uniref:DUF4766 domain-containing protein n=1 Tax=Glossina austeni TaxID=7395 RepID=A0A1A9V6Q0_GLOAU
MRNNICLYFLGILAAAQAGFLGLFNGGGSYGGGHYDDHEHHDHGNYEDVKIVKVISHDEGYGHGGGYGGGYHSGGHGGDVKYVQVVHEDGHGYGHGGYEGGYGHGGYEGGYGHGGGEVKIVKVISHGGHHEESYGHGHGCSTFMLGTVTLKQEILLGHAASTQLYREILTLMVELELVATPKNDAGIGKSAGAFFILWGEDSLPLVQGSGFFGPTGADIIARLAQLTGFRTTLGPFYSHLTEFRLSII